MQALESFQRQKGLQCPKGLEEKRTQVQFKAQSGDKGVKA